MRRDVFLALAAVAWADGRLDPDEADAIVRAAAEEGLDLDEIASGGPRNRRPPGTEQGRSPLRVRRRVLDRAPRRRGHRRESRALARLGERLGIPERPRGHAEAVAREVAELPEGDRPARYDLVALRRILGERLRASPSRGGAAGPARPPED